MKKTRGYRGIAFLAMALVLSAVSGFAGEKPEAPSKSGISWKNLSQTVKEKYREEMEAVQKDTTEAGQEIQKSYTELPAKAGEDSKKTREALKNAGREIKEGATESWRSLKNLFKKKGGEGNSPPAAPE